jgi:peptidoglycan DL-endopeptidase CwlO
MGLALRARRGGFVAVVALVLSVAPGAAAVAAVAGSEAAASPTSFGGTLPPATVGASAGVVSSPTPTPSSSPPTEEDVARAKRAAAAAAKEVAGIRAEVKKAGERLQALQREVADSVAAQERAEQRLTDAEGDLRRAAAALAAAHRALDGAHRSLSGHAAAMYMQGGDLQNLTALLLSPPGAMSDMTIVIDQSAREVSEGLDTASSAAVEAAVQKRLITVARDERAAAAKDAADKRTAAEAKAKRGSAEAAALGKRQEELTARLDRLRKGAKNLAEDLAAAQAARAAAARQATTLLVGTQAPAGAPRAAQEIAHSMMAGHGWDDAQFSCLVALWNAESGWSWSALNPSSGAYGIPQSLPGWKMASAGSDWLTNPATQITWGLGYIQSTYGSPCSAHASFLSRSPHWY